MLRERRRIEFGVRRELEVRCQRDRIDRRDLRRDAQRLGLEGPGEIGRQAVAVQIGQAVLDRDADPCRDRKRGVGLKSDEMRREKPESSWQSRLDREVRELGAFVRALEAFQRYKRLVELDADLRKGVDGSAGAVPCVGWSWLGSSSRHWQGGGMVGVWARISEIG
jgi:hypothetical protein